MVETAAIGKLMGGMLAGGGIGAIASAIDTTGKLILRWTENDPVKRTKMLREYYMSMIDVVKEVRGLEDGKDASDLVSLIDRILSDK